MTPPKLSGDTPVPREHNKYYATNLSRVKVSLCQSTYFGRQRKSEVGLHTVIFVPIPSWLKKPLDENVDPYPGKVKMQF